MHALPKYLPHVVWLACLGSGLMAGLFFAFSTFVMQALARLPPAQGAFAMQQINASVTTALFGLAFFGTALACLVVVALAAPRALSSVPAALFCAGGLLYLLGVIAVTIAFNVPLNNALARLAAQEAAAYWPVYVDSWQRWNHVRTVLATAALACFAWGLYRAGQP